MTAAMATGDNAERQKECLMNEDVGDRSLVIYECITATEVGCARQNKPVGSK